MNSLEITLTLPDPVQPKFCRLTLDGGRLIRASWTGGRRPRVTTKDLDVQSGSHAKRAFGRARDEMMRKGYCRVSDAGGAARGETVLEMLVPNRCPADVFDISPDGGSLVVGTMLAGAYGAEIHLVDIATGRRRLVHSEPPEPGPAPLGKGQTFLHTVLFHPDGEQIVYLLNGETRLLDPLSGRQRRLAAYREGKDAAFNPFCVHPAWNRNRTRLLVFDAGTMVRVLDADGSPLWEVCTADPVTQCRAGALSPSGQLVALHRASRGVIYRHEDALHDVTNEIEVWDITAGRPIARIPAPVAGRTVHRVGFDPAEGLIVGNPDPVQGPCGMSISTGELAWHFPHGFLTSRWDTCYAWDYSPDGAMLAIGRRDLVDIVDAGMPAGDPASGLGPSTDDRTGPTGRTNRVRFSGDGRLLAYGGDSGRLVIRKIR
ncbi:WD40 repeat domain-containing protein [Actinoplanes regularis]|uniref:WD40 repeat domain-containing protein n=1 Tax=Actinoplanes regularis TaxID=52697 RepID=UPI0024A16A0A|nr:hypothetical protein [Actinoplanes regularis]GLW28261.1 hypothetical protein Areg01_12010 [Actinoplanes regularis]